MKRTMANKKSAIYERLTFLELFYEMPMGYQLELTLSSLLQN